MKFRMMLLVAGLALLLSACTLAAPAPTAEPTDVGVLTLYVGPRRVSCEATGPELCFLIKESPDAQYRLYNSTIEGLEYEEGYAYELRVRLVVTAAAPADGSPSSRYDLVEVVSQTAVDISEPFIDLVIPEDGDSLNMSAPITVSGFGWALFEGTVVVEARDASGNVLAQVPTIVASENAGTGGGGAWSVELTVSAPAGSTGTIHAYAASPRDGSIDTEDSVAVTFVGE